MHLLARLAIEGDVDHDRRKGRGNGRGGQQHAADRIEGARMAAAGNRADVPDDRLLCVEVGRGDQQQAARLVGAGDGSQHRGIDILRDQAEQRRIVGHRVVEQGGCQAALAQHAFGRGLGVNAAQLAVIGRTKEGKGGAERTRADAGHELELGTRALLSPATQQAGAERPILAAAGDRQELPGRQLGGRSQPEGSRLAIHGKADLHLERSRSVGREEALVRKTEHARVSRASRWHGGAALRQAAGHQHRRDAASGDQAAASDAARHRSPFRPS